MNRTDAADRLAAGYLEAVGAAMAGRPEQERRDVLAQLAEQLDVAVRAAEFNITVKQLFSFNDIFFKITNMI